MEHQEQTGVQIERLVGQADFLFGKTSIHEVINMTDRDEIIKTLSEFYGLVEVGKGDEYILILKKLR